MGEGSLHLKVEFIIRNGSGIGNHLGREWLVRLCGPGSVVIVGQGRGVCDGEGSGAGAHVASGTTHAPCAEEGK